MVLVAIPFGFVGALLGHMIMGLNASAWTAMGLVAVSGVVVNDNLVLVDYINRKRKSGVAMAAAIRAAGAARFRPIVLTSVTTFFGLLPLLSEQSAQAKFLMPMVVSLAFGVMFATFVTLFLVPALYFIIEDFLALFRRLAALFYPNSPPPAAVALAPSAGLLNAPVENVPARENVDPMASQRTGEVSLGGVSDLPASEATEPAVDDEIVDDIDEQIDSLLEPDTTESATSFDLSRGPEWDEALENAFQQGFEQGIRGDELECRLDSEDLAQSWASGWSEGHEAYKLSKPQS